MSYTFNGTTSIVTAAAQGAAMNDAFAIFALIKITETTDATWESIVEFHITAGTNRCAMGRRNNGQLYFASSNGIADAITANDSDGWCRFWVIRSAAAATELGKASIGTTTPTTGAGDTLSDGLTAAGGPVYFGGSSDPFHGKMAVVAWWESGTMPTSAALAACVTTADLLALNPHHCYDAGDDSDLVTDLVGSLTMTPTALTEDTGDDPTWVYQGAGPHPSHRYMWMP